MAGVLGEGHPSLTVVTLMAEHLPTATVFVVWNSPKHASPVARSAARRTNFAII